MIGFRILIVLGVFAFGSPASSATKNVETGAAALKTGDYATAVTSFKAAYKAADKQTVANQTAALMGWGDALAGLGDMEGARHMYKKALALSPESRPLLFRLRNLGIGP
jgi:Flp pilus assembly protein TadD